MSALKSAMVFCRALILMLLIASSGYATELQNTRQMSFASYDTVTPVIELYTSEGCSSCPRADNFITRLGDIIDENFHAVPLAFHVDYWNWLGWKDPFSKPEYTERQREIGDFNNQSSIYTPEIVVGGKESRGGLNIVEKIKQSNTRTATVSIQVNLVAVNQNQLDADFDIDNMTSLDDVQAYIAIYENDIVREIRGGENNGKTLTHDFVVRHWSEPIALSNGKSSSMLSLDIGHDWDRENLGIAVVVVDGANGQTLQSVNANLDLLFAI